MNEKRVAVLGTYRSGSSIVAAMLHALGVDMGAPYWQDYYEPGDLSCALRRWWREPELIADEPASNRVLLLRQWLDSRRMAECVGCKHPLLALSSQDILRAWGNNTKFIWCHRPLADSIESLRRVNWWSDPQRIQETLYLAADDFFPRSNGLVIEYDDSLRYPGKIVQRLIDFLGLSPTADQVQAAIKMVRPPQQIATVNALASGQPESCQQAGKIVATVIADNSQSIIGDAIASVSTWVDQVILLDTGITDSSIEAARQVAGDKLIVHKFEWGDDFSAARNHALELATNYGAEWACTLDTDERLEFESSFDPLQIRQLLSREPEVEVWLARSADGSYFKERLVRLPTKSKWKGRTHEFLSGASEKAPARLPGLVFDEIAKSNQEISKKLERDLVLLRQEIQEEPESGHNWYYLGQTLLNLGQPEGAIACFDRCTFIRDCDELATWACYMSAKSHAELDLYDEAIERCAVGLAIDAQSPEIAWMAAWSCFKIGECAQAIAWSHIAISLGLHMGIGKNSNRLGFRDLVGWYEGPFDILFHTYSQLGDQSLSQQAKEDFEQARKSRLERFHSQR